MATEARSSRSPSSESTPVLLGHLVGDARDLAIAHLDQVRAEMGDEISALGDSLRETALTFGVILLGAVLLGQALALGIAALLGVPSWAGYAIAAALTIGAALVLRASFAARNKRQTDLVPEASLDAIADDARAIAHQAGAALNGETASRQ